MNWKVLFLFAGCLGLLSGCFEAPQVGGGSDDSTEELVDDEATPAELKSSLETAEKRIEGLNKRLDGLKKTLAKATGEYVPKSNSDDDEKSSDEDEEIISGPGAEYLEKLNEMDEYFSSELDLWRAATRDSFVGIKLKEVKTTGGQTYAGVEIKKVSSDTLEITHSGGEASVPIMELEEGLRKNLIHEETILGE